MCTPWIGGKTACRVHDSHDGSPSEPRFSRPVFAQLRNRLSRGRPDRFINNKFPERVDREVGSSPVRFCDNTSLWTLDGKGKRNSVAPRTSNVSFSSRVFSLRVYMEEVFISNRQRIELAQKFKIRDSRRMSIYDLFNTVKKKGVFIIFVIFNMRFLLLIRLYLNFLRIYKGKKGVYWKIWSSSRKQRK